MEKRIEYRLDETVMEGFLVMPEQTGRPSPAVLISHAWGGQGEFDNNKARALAALGYAGFALDLYGKGVRGDNPEQNAKLMQPLLADRGVLQARMLAAYDTLRAQPGIDPERIAAMGFCFGGLCVLDLARTGADLRGVISLHGFFTPPGNTAGNRISAKVLALHGYDDPMVAPESIDQLAAEMTAAGVDWQVHVYGNTKHAFTNPKANDPVRGTVYQPVADQRSWQATVNFLEEIFRD